MTTTSSTLSPETAYWKAVLSQAQSLKLPSDFPRQIVEGASISSQTIEYAWTSPKPIENLASAFETTFAADKELVASGVSSFVRAVYGVLLARYTLEENFVVGLASNQPSQETLIQFDTNTGEPSSNANLFIEFFRRSLATHQKGIQNVQQSTLKENLQVVFQDAKNPEEQYEQFINATFSTSNDLKGNETKPFQLTNPDFHLHFDSAKQSISLSYQKALFTIERVQEMVGQIELLIKQTLANPNTSIYDYTVVTTESLQNIPNPAEVLSKKWEGSVVSYLEKHAVETPEKIMMVDRHEAISYKVLNEMSNKLARELIDQGLQKQEIVAIFGHRSTPVVWAIASILKAGAAYTMIDPAYPPQRIIDCIKVSTPVAIITIEAGGKLPAEVKQFIKSSHKKNKVRFVYTLKPITETIQTEDLNDHDGSNLTEVEIGPEDIAVCTFTSGSTGKPKGVLGRHGPLTHYYPWMRDTFKFTSEEQYSMQSGIAHDPLQRDIFTPWFLGATLHIPDPEDIVNPGKLAQWFKKCGITVTHLTPAMGQLLTSSAAAAGGEENGEKILLPSLRYAFFVGDVLSKKFVRRMCSHAPNCYVINLYGSTESQRSVSYYLVPRPQENPQPTDAFEKLKDIVPVGKGMKDIQAVVLSRFTSNGKFQLAGVGELGEIFMRSPHLARGYKGKPEETAQKFIPNPFLVEADDGDRMYRTGDIGRFLPTGDVECLGRADDQVKIRGFRIELGEVNTALNSHDLVKESVTIVRTDMVAGSDEKKIVAYVVLDGTNKEVAEALAAIEKSSQGQATTTQQGDEDNVVQLNNVGHLIRVLRKHLRTKLPDYMIPAAIVALEKLPLTPNGKIKRNALPKPDAALPDEDFVAPRNALEQQLSEIWCEVLGVKVIGIHDNFFDLGGHSISATTLTFKTRTRVEGAGNLPVELLYRAPTIGAMAVAIQRMKGGKQSAEKAAKVVDFYNDTILDADIYPENTPSQQEAFEYLPTWANPKAILLTGATGFLGTFLLSDLLKHTQAKVYCLVRASSKEVALERVIGSLFSHKLVWNTEKPTTLSLASSTAAVDLKKFEQFLRERIVAVLGDLSKPLLGLTQETFNQLADEVDVILHNGALVHWMYPYEKLKAANVGGTQEILRLACKGKKVKPVHYVSTTSVFDSDHYSHLSDVFESSDLPYHEDLRGGYPQSKYVAEKLVMNARKRGVPAAVYRPGYVTGHSDTGVWNPDDYLCRMIKGCIQMGIYPDFPMTKLDMSPVDFVSRAIVALMLKKESLTKHKAYHMVNPNEFFFNELFNMAIRLGYPIKPVNVEEWKDTLFTTVLSKKENDEDQNALYPMLTYFSDDFGARMRTTKRPWFDNTNTLDGLKNSGINCPSVVALMGTYYKFLCQCGFLATPKQPTELAIRLGFDMIIPAEQPTAGSYYDSESNKQGMKRSSSSSSMHSSSSFDSLSNYKELMRTRN